MTTREVMTTGGGGDDPGVVATGEAMATDGE
jgi:hypothetical protein